MLSGEGKENGEKITIGLIKPGFHMSGKSRTMVLTHMERAERAKVSCVVHVL